MKQFFYLTMISIFFTACGGNPEGQKVEASDAVETNSTATEAEANNILVVNTTASTVHWVGSKLTGKQHKGTIALSEGELQIEDGNLTGGKFTLDMTSMKNTDLPADQGPKLVAHLSSGDFFEVERFPASVFTISSVKPAGEEDNATHLITGNLQLKDVIKSITFPATIAIQDGSLKAETTDFVINRTEWNVEYGSTLFGAAKDKAIGDDIGLKIIIVAGK